MFAILRFLFIASIIYFVFRIVRRILIGFTFQNHHSSGTKYDSSKEVKNARFTEDDIQDARYKDIK